MRVPLATPTPYGQQLRLLTDQLEKSQWWSLENLQQYQDGLLVRLLAHAYETVPFYRMRLAAAGYRPRQAITPEFWRSLPILRRSDLQDQGDALRSASVPAEHGSSFKISTSGSTAMPVSVWRTQLQALILEAVVLRKLLWQSCDLRLKFGVIIRDPTGASVAPAGRRFANWGASAQAYQTGPAVMLDNRSSVAEIADWLLREKPDYLRIVPALLKDLSFHFLDRGLVPTHLKGIMSGGAVIGPDLRELVRRAFGLDLFASYGASEVGTIALQCPEHEHYHVQEEATMVEVLNGRGDPSAPGETGTVVITPLQGYASPLIRYEIGDRAVAGATCSCGRPHPVLKQVVGRMRDLFVLPSGERRFCDLGDLAFYQLSDLRQCQIVQRSFNDLEVRLVVRRRLTPEVEAEVAQRIKAATSEHFSVGITYHDSIPLTPAGKFQDFVCEVDAVRAPGAQP
jgi:phenylacetate-CoA ligase